MAHPKNPIRRLARIPKVVASYGRREKNVNGEEKKERYSAKIADESTKTSNDRAIIEKDLPGRNRHRDRLRGRRASLCRRDASSTFSPQHQRDDLANAVTADPGLVGLHECGDFIVIDAAEPDISAGRGIADRDPN
ncbi:hypothetical protein [Bradyrhizobium sp. CCGUVB14]|uniref:hypothetical protein n=1 Tax=Bradyrhizobium sp. CCGUVB14 TaxID=2949628 RepID=UPI0020B44B93|nr:hypothetical protein [Bradyrhizobium sp. CCGUVB14]MCP3441295.1 hypothetical protein [Bradyrhizobium sp. CCGUVB14]